MHRRLLVSFFAVPVLLLTLAAPTMAAPPLKESGTQLGFTSFASECSATICTETVLDAYTMDADTAVVCLYSYSYNIRNGRLVSEQSGCTETTASAITLSGDLDAELAETSITFLNCNRRGCTEGDTVLVSAQDSAVSPVRSETSRGTFSDGTCTYRYRLTGESADIAGTMTIDGVVYEQWGWASISQYSVTSRCN